MTEGTKVYRWYVSDNTLNARGLGSYMETGTVVHYKDGLGVDMGYCTIKLDDSWRDTERSAAVAAAGKVEQVMERLRQQIAMLLATEVPK